MSKQIAKISDKLTDIQAELEILAEEAQEYYDNRSEKWQESEKGDEWQEKISALEDAANSVGDAIDYLGDWV